MKKIVIFGFICFSLFLGGLKVALAEDVYACQCNDGNQFKTTSAAECTTKCGDKGVASVVKVAAAAAGKSLPNPLGITDINTLIARVINVILSLVGSISLLMFVYGGLTWMTSAGSADKIKKGREIIVWAIIGLGIVFTSYILVKFVIQSLAGSNG